MADNNEKKLSYEQYITDIIGAADSNYNAAVENAETARNKQISAANNGYQRALSQYGKQAESLSASGLQGSGFSKYLDSKAYAQKQADIYAAYQTEANTKAAAQATRDAAQLEAKGMMAQYLQQKEAEDLAYERQTTANKLNAFNTLMGNIGAYNSIEDIKALAAANGIGDADPMLQNLAEARSAYIRNNLTGTKYTLKQLNDLYNNGNGELNETDYKALKDSVFNPKKGDIQFNGDNYDEEYAAYNDVLSTLPTRSEAEKAGDNTLLTKEDLTEQFNQMYGAKVFDKTFKVMWGNKKEDGKNIRIEDDDGNVYKVQYASGEDDEAATKAALQKKIHENQFFEYRGKIYLYTKDGSFLIEDRDFNIPWSEKKRYGALVESLKN